MVKFIKKIVSGSAMVLTVATATMGTAHAVPVPGTWDPAFSATTFGGLNGLGWRGTLLVDVPNSGTCFTPAASPNVNNSTGCSAPGDMTFLSATVQFYDIAGAVDLGSPIAVTGLIIDHVDFTPTGTIPLLNSVHMANWSANFAGPTSDYSNDQYLFSLTFDMLTGEAFLRAKPGAYFSDPYGCAATESGYCISNAATVHYTPEPGSLVLALSALLGAGWVRRRRA